MTAFEGQLLSVLLFLPLCAGLFLLAFQLLIGLLGGELPDSAWRGVGLGSSLLTFGVSLQLFVQFDAAAPGFQFVQHVPWLPSYGIHYFVGVDGISLLLVVLTAFLMPLVLLGAWNEERSLRSFVFFNLLLETGMFGALVSLNLFQFYLFWEAMLVPMYFIIGIWGGPRRIYAAIKFFLFTMAGSLLMLVAMIAVSYLHWEQFGALNFDLIAAPGVGAPALLDTAISAGPDTQWWRGQYWLFGAFALAFAVKVPMVPLHTWLPDAHVEAPTAGSVILAGVLLKMGTYGFVRFALPLFPVAADAFVPLFFGLATIGVLYGALVAMVQTDIKRLVAYSSVAHLGFVVLGIFALNEEGLQGSVLQMINHGLSTGALFLLVGMIYERRKTREIADLGGLARPLPVFAAIFGVVVMSSIGVPGLNGFVGEFLILVGVFARSPWIGVAATFGVVLAAVYLLWMFRRVMFGPCDNPENQALLDLDLREKAILAAFLIPIFWIGVYPNFFLTRVGGSVSELLHTMQRRTEVTRVLDRESNYASRAQWRRGQGE